MPHRDEQDTAHSETQGMLNQGTLSLLIGLTGSPQRNQLRNSKGEIGACP